MARAALTERSIRAARNSTTEVSTTICRSMNSFTRTALTQRIVGLAEHRGRARAAAATADRAWRCPSREAVCAPSAARSSGARGRVEQVEQRVLVAAGAVAILDHQRPAGDEVRHVLLPQFGPLQRPGVALGPPR